MTAFFVVLKVSALLAIIIFPLIGPKKKEPVNPVTLSNIAVNENGFLEQVTTGPANHHHVQ
jgi:hypothetical protein